MVVLLAIRFLAELGLLAALAWGGWQAGGSTPVSLLLAVGLPAVAAVVWGRWVAPRASARLRDPGRVVVELVLFALAILLLVLARAVPAAVGLAAAYLVSVPSRGHEPTG